MKRKRRKKKLVDDIYESQKKYLESEKGKEAAKRAKDKYDSRDRAKRRKQKRDYMRRKRKEDKNIWR
jgi:hypothetical protein